MADIDSAPLLSAPAGFSVVSPNSSDSEEDVNHGFDRRRHSRNFSRREVDPSMGYDDLSFSCFGFVLIIWFFVSVMMTVVVYGPKTVWIGPNSSILIEPNPIFVQSVKVKDLDDSKSGLELFGFYRSPPLDVVVNWSESRLASVSHRTVKVWPFYLNEGASLNISFSVKPEGRTVRLVVDEGTGTYWLLDNRAYLNNTLSWNLIRGSGMIEVKIRKSSGYYVAVANSNMKDLEVELDIDVRTVLYDTKQSFYKCNFSNGECTFNAMSLYGNSIVLTSPALRQGASLEEEEWNIMISYQPRWTSYVVITGLLICFVLVFIRFWKRLQCLGEERDLSENDSARTRLLANKDDYGSRSKESFSADDADMEALTGNEGNNGTRRLCAICFDAPRDCFFMPCGHCVSCYQCGTKISEAAGSCPICRRKMKKVKRIYTV